MKISFDEITITLSLKGKRVCGYKINPIKERRNLQNRKKAREKRNGDKFKFLNKYLGLFKDAFPESRHRAKKINHSDWKKPSGRRLVELAREQIGFSDTTANMDIFWNLYIFYANTYLKRKK